MQAIDVCIPVCRALAFADETNNWVPVGNARFQRKRINPFNGQEIWVELYLDKKMGKWRTADVFGFSLCNKKTFESFELAAMS